MVRSRRFKLLSQSPCIAGWGACLGASAEPTWSSWSWIAPTCVLPRWSFEECSSRWTSSVPWSVSSFSSYLSIFQPPDVPWKTLRWGCKARLITGTVLCCDSTSIFLSTRTGQRAEVNLRAFYSNLEHLETRARAVRRGQNERSPAMGWPVAQSGQCYRDSFPLYAAILAVGINCQPSKQLFTGWAGERIQLAAYVKGLISVWGMSCIFPIFSSDFCFPRQGRQCDATGCWWWCNVTWFAKAIDVSGQISSRPKTRPVYPPNGGEK